MSRLGHAGDAGRRGKTAPTFEYAFEPRVEAITTPFAIYPGVAIPAGRYDWTQHLFALESDHSRALSGSARFTLGEFWSGTQRTLQTSVLYRPTYRLVFDLGLQVSDIDLQIPQASFVSTLVQPPRRLLVQLEHVPRLAACSTATDVKQFSANVRFNLIHRPLSDFFVVYNESQFTDTDADRPAAALVVKYTQMLSF